MSIGIAALRPGTQIDGRYVIVDEIGAGTQGVVYRAEDVFLGRLVAIKVVSTYQPDYEPLDPVFARALAKEPEGRQPTCLAFAEELEAAGADTQRASVPTRAVLRARFQLRDLRAPHVLAHVSDDAFARRLEKAVEKAMPVSIYARFTAGSDLVAAFERKAAVAIVIDEDATTTSPATLVDVIRKLPGGADARVIVLSRDWRPSPHDGSGVKSLPKPVNMQLFASVLTA